MIVNLVAQDADQPGTLRALAGEAIMGFHCGQKGVLDEVFGFTNVTKLAHGEVEKEIAVQIQPLGGVGTTGYFFHFGFRCCYAVHHEAYPFAMAVPPSRYDFIRELASHNLHGLYGRKFFYSERGVDF